ncbi:MAG TPA: enoyl-CoA hydratase/isomerase family protein [Vicinamibacteria bacterium]
MSAVTAEERGGAAWISLSRPPLNVLDIATIRSLEAALRPLASRADLKSVVIRSALPGVFSAGVDVRDHARERISEMLSSFHAVLRVLHELPQVSVAAVDGACLGGGCELAACCDLVLATEASTFGQPEIDVGCFPPFACALLPRLVGRAAYELVLGGAAISAREAERIGLVTRVVTDLPAEAAAWTERLSRKSAAALALARRALREGSEGPLWEAVGRTERLYRDELAATEDAEEGVRAFLEKRPPRWRNR